MKEGFFSILCRGVAELRYKAWGETRYTWGTTPTTYRYTGQRQEEGLGLYHMGARFYDPALSRWLSADTLIPDPANPQSFNRYSYVNNRPLVAIDPTGHDLMIVGGAGGDMDPIVWQQWIMAYKGWSTEEWKAFYEAWSGAADFASKNKVLAAEGIGIFTWGGNTMEEAISNAGSGRNVDMLDELANQMAGMKDVTLIGWSKGGSLVMHYLKRLEKGQIEGIKPLRAVLLAPATHPLGKYKGTGWQNNYVPESGPRTVNICSQGDAACPLTIRNAWLNFNPLWEGHGHGPHGDYAETVIRTLEVAGHHGANPDTYQDGWYIRWQYKRSH